MSHLNAIVPELRQYADMALADGMTVFAAENPEIRPDGTPVPLAWFHYGRQVGDRFCYGTVTLNSFGHVDVHMPRTPDREYGSAVVVYSQEMTSQPLTIEVLRKAARPKNGHVWATSPGDRKWAALQDNARPWGVGERYTEVV